MWIALGVVVFLILIFIGMYNGLVGKNDVQEISERLHDFWPLNSAPKLWAASSITGKLYFSAIKLISSKFAHCQ